MNVWRPATLREALEIRAGSGAIPLAGGTDLMVRWRRPGGALPAPPGDVLLLGGLRELREVRPSSGRVRIGAGCTLSDLLDSPEVPELLKRAAREMASPAVRGRATLGGNICNASPAGDTLPPLYVLEARVRLASTAGERVLPIEDFITGPGQTVLAGDEILVAVEIPAAPRGAVAYYRKVGTRRANALAKVSLAALGGRLALGAVSPTVVRSREAERDLAAREAGDILRRYAALIRPIDDARSSAAYRRQVALNLIEEYLRRGAWTTESC